MKITETKNTEKLATHLNIFKDFVINLKYSPPYNSSFDKLAEHVRTLLSKGFRNK